MVHFFLAHPVQLGEGPEAKTRGPHHFNHSGAPNLYFHHCLYAISHQHLVTITQNSHNRLKPAMWNVTTASFHNAILEEMQTFHWTQSEWISATSSHIICCQQSSSSVWDQSLWLPLCLEMKGPWSPGPMLNANTPGLTISVCSVASRYLIRWWRWVEILTQLSNSKVKA